MLQSMGPDGVVTMQSGEPVLERRSTSEAPPRLERLRPRALADAAAFRDGVQRLTGRRLWVQAVVVFWSEFPAGCVADGRCVFIHGSRLAEWMARRPHQLDPRDADEVYAAVEALAQPRSDASLRVAVEPDAGYVQRVNVPADVELGHARLQVVGAGDRIGARLALVQPGACGARPLAGDLADAVGVGRAARERVRHVLHAVGVEQLHRVVAGHRVGAAQQHAVLDRRAAAVR